jgi:hypothetical protein
MRLPATLHRLVAALVVIAGMALVASALNGVARMDTSLEMAATRSTPDHALVQETSYDCPYRAQRDEV